MTGDAGIFDPQVSCFDPYTSTSGTEAVAPLLYAIVRMLRPINVIEYGPGYSTMFLLKGLAENDNREHIEREALARKTQQSGILGLVPHRKDDDRSPWSEDAKAAYRAWLYADGPACGADPSFYRTRPRPRLHSFETLPSDHPYSQRVRQAISALGLENYFEPHYGEGFAIGRLPSQALPVDLAWNDCDQYRPFFSEYWEHLRPDGGMMIFHNVTAWSPMYDEICWMSAQRKSQNDLEILVLEEPHKLNQNSCAILRRRTNPPRFGAERPHGVLNALREFLSQITNSRRTDTTRDGPPASPEMP